MTRTDRQAPHEPKAQEVINAMGHPLHPLPMSRDHLPAKEQTSLHRVKLADQSVSVMTASSIIPSQVRHLEQPCRSCGDPVGSILERCAALAEIGEPARHVERLYCFDCAMSCITAVSIGLALFSAQGQW